MRIGDIIWRVLGGAAANFLKYDFMTSSRSKFTTSVPLSMAQNNMSSFRDSQEGNIFYRVPIHIIKVLCSCYLSSEASCIEYPAYLFGRCHCFWAVAFEHILSHSFFNVGPCYLCPSFISCVKDVQELLVIAPPLPLLSLSRTPSHQGRTFGLNESPRRYICASLGETRYIPVFARYDMVLRTLDFPLFLSARR